MEYRTGSLRSQADDAAKRRIDPAETLRSDLKTYFKGMGKKHEAEPSAKKAKRDFDALLKGKKDGCRKIIDETFKDAEEMNGEE